MSRKDALHVTQVRPNGYRANAGRGISYDGIACDEGGMPIEVHFINDTRQLLFAAGIDPANWDEHDDTPVDFYVLAEAKMETIKGKRQLMRRMKELTTGDGIWWQRLEFGNKLQISDRVLLESQTDGSAQGVVEVETLDKVTKGVAERYMVVNGQYEVRASQPVVVGRA